MSDNTELLTAQEATDILGVTRDRLDVLASEGLLTPVHVHDVDGEEPRYQRAEIEALRLQGG